MFENAFNNIDNTLREDDGCDTELDYAEQTSWILFLKYLDDLEGERSDTAELESREYQPLLEPEYRWAAWAMPKVGGRFDHNAALVGDDLIAFVNEKLFPYLGGFKERAQSPDDLEYKIGEIFSFIKNKLTSGYNLREILDVVDGLRFNTSDEKHELSDLYETRIKRMGNAGRTGGQYYTPRALIRAMIQVIDPKLGETIYDGAAGSAGFLCEAFEYLRPKATNASDWETLQKRTLYGQEYKSLAFTIGVMNMILHGIEAPNYAHTDTLNQNVMDIQEKDRVDVVLANPPFGGKFRKEIGQNFPIRSGETAYLFVQHFIRKLRSGGRAAIVIKNTFLSNIDNASVSLRKELVETCNLHTVLDCPDKTFQGTGQKTVVLFFEKGKPTQDIWYYQLDPGRSLGKQNPLNDDDLKDFVGLQKAFTTGEKSWTVSKADLDEATCDLSVKNPNAPEEAPLRSPEVIIDDMLARDTETAKILEYIRGML